MSPRRLTAVLVTVLFGGTLGLVIGFLNSGLVGVSGGFYYWIAYPIDSLHWPVLGGLLGGLAALALHLWLPEKGVGKRG